MKFFLLSVVFILHLLNVRCQWNVLPKNEPITIKPGEDLTFNCSYSPSATILNAITWTKDPGTARQVDIHTWLSSGTVTVPPGWQGRTFADRSIAGLSLLFINQTTESDAGTYHGDIDALHGKDICSFIVSVTGTTTPERTTESATTEASRIPGTDDGWTSGGPTTEKNNSCKGHCQRVCIPTKPRKNAGIACGAVILVPGVVLTVMTVGSMLKLWALPYEKKKGKEVVAGKPMVGINADDNRNATTERQDIDESRNKAKTRKIQFASITGGSICVAGGSLCLGLCIGLPLCCCA